MSLNKDDDLLITAIEKDAYPVGEALWEYDPIIDAAADKQLVLIGEATHGSEEFYRTRADITKRLIEEHGFNAIAVEADWPDAYAINRYVNGLATVTKAEEALNNFERFPSWMWANHEVLDFIKWLRAFNDTYHKKSNNVGFYGLDFYSINTSVQAVISYLEDVDQDDAAQARKRYSCLEYFMEKPHAYKYMMDQTLADKCEEEIVAQLIDLREKSYEYMKLDGLLAEDEYFCAEQNAKLICNAQNYYRTMFGTSVTPRPNLWNMRDNHMFETLESLKNHFDKRLEQKAKIIVWAHNSHVGNAAATEMSDRGEINIGQLVKEAYGKRALLIGFSTAKGTVTAASNWAMPAERKNIRTPIPGSYEDIFHKVNHKNFFLNIQENNETTDLLCVPRLQRAIGVIYRPESERESHYFHSSLPDQFDFMIHFDDTKAVKPLEIGSYWHRGELDETYPSGL